MSDDLLFFSLETSTDVSAKNDIAVAADSGNKSQVHEFKKILEGQISDSDKKNTDTEPAENQITNIDEAQQDIELEDVPAVSRPVLQGVDENLGKTLPSLTVHGRALEVGRVILTTAKPVVDENSLSEFVRKQVQSDKGPVQEAVTLGRGLKGRLEDPLFQPNAGHRSVSAGDVSTNSIGKASKSSEFPLGQRMLSSELKEQTQQLRSPINVNTGLAINEAKLAIAKQNRSAHLTARGLPPVIEQANTGKLDKNWIVKDEGSLLNKHLTPVKDEKLIKASLGKRDSSETAMGLDRNFRLDRQYSRINKAEGLNKLKEGSNSKIEGSVSPKTLEVDRKPQTGDPLKFLQMREVFKVGNDMAIPESSEFDISELPSTSASETRRFGGPVIVEPAQDIDVRARAVARDSITNLGEILTSKVETRDNFLRTEQYSNWSQRFGEILGQRLSVAINQGSWNVKLNLHPSSLGHIDIKLDIGEKGIEGQINSADPVARQLLQDSLPKLRATLAELYDQGESINLSLGDKEKSGSGSEKPDNSLEVAIDLLAEEFAVEDGQALTVNGLDLFV
jgi:hypothetical protein